MRFKNSSLFVNTGRKPLSGMQKRKKNNKNNVFLILCIAIIAVLCIFVGLIARVWINYDADEKADAKTSAVSENSISDKNSKTADATKKKKATKKAAKKTTKKTSKNTTKKVTTPKYISEGTASEYSKSVDKMFTGLDGTYAYGMLLMNDNYKYINNTEKINNSTAVSAFLVEYICAKIYTGEFDYDTDVSGQSGNYLIDKLIIEGNADAANALISYFTPQRLNAYMAAQGYSSTSFGGLIGDGNSYTTVSDLMALMQKIYNKSKVFPYSDLYKRMRKSQVNSRIRNQLPYETVVANISAAYSNEMFDAAIVYTPIGNYIFVSLANGFTDDGTAANTAMSSGAKVIFDQLNN